MGVINLIEDVSAVNSSRDNWNIFDIVVRLDWFYSKIWTIKTVSQLSRYVAWRNEFSAL